MNCRNCKEHIINKELPCPTCGNKYEKKDADIAAFVSLIFPGLGQAYNCDIYKALSYFAIAFVIVVMSILLIIASIIIPKIWADALVVITIGIIFWAYNIIDAYKEA